MTLENAFLVIVLGTLAVQVLASFAIIVGIRGLASMFSTTHSEQDKD